MPAPVDAVCEGPPTPPIIVLDPAYYGGPKWNEWPFVDRDLPESTPPPPRPKPKPVTYDVHPLFWFLPPCLHKPVVVT